MKLTRFLTARDEANAKRANLEAIEYLVTLAFAIAGVVVGAMVGIVVCFIAMLAAYRLLSLDQQPHGYALFVLISAGMCLDAVIGGVKGMLWAVRRRQATQS